MDIDEFLDRELSDLGLQTDKTEKPETELPDFKEQLEVIKSAIEEKEIHLNEAPKENYNFEEALDLCFNFFLTVPDYWKGATYNQKIKLQGSIFSKKPSYQYPSFETPNFSLIFQQKRGFASANPPVVARRGIEPLFHG